MSIYVVAVKHLFLLNKQIKNFLLNNFESLTWLNVLQEQRRLALFFTAKKALEQIIRES